jgi:polyisoprenyl-phosphate glycosyltransferase
MCAVYHVLSARPDPVLLSIVIPAYNEQEVLPELRKRLTGFLTTLPCGAEVVVVNDGSSDRTLPMLLEWADADPRIKVLGLARNFGHQSAVTAGLDAATGDAVIIMDADLQDPPEVILEMLAEYRKGYDVVYGQRTGREGETFFKRLMAWAFYRFMSRFIHKDLPADSGDFRLVSRPCLDAVKKMRETHRFLRGMVAWVGFAQTAVRYQRHKRIAGETKYPLRKMIRFAWTAAISFSPAPLRLSLALGVIVAFCGFAEGAYAVVWTLLGYHVAPGWASLMAVICLVGGGILISIGVLGEYVGRIFEETKNRPLYIVSTRANLGGEAKTKSAAALDKPLNEWTWA